MEFWMSIDMGKIFSNKLYLFLILGFMLVGMIFPANAQISSLPFNCPINQNYDFQDTTPTSVQVGGISMFVCNYDQDKVMTLYDPSSDTDCSTMQQVMDSLSSQAGTNEIHFLKSKSHWVFTAYTNDLSATAKKLISLVEKNNLAPSCNGFDESLFENDEQKVNSEIQTGNSEGGGCLIATAAYGSELAPQVQFLREIRDNTVLSTSSGTAFMSGFNQLYYSFSPTIADIERENPLFQEAVRTFITPMVSTLSIMTLAADGSEIEVLGLGISVIALNLGIYIAAPSVTAWQIKKRL